MKSLEIIFCLCLLLLMTLSNLKAQPQVSDDNYTCIWHTTGNTDTSGLGFCLVSVGDQNQDGFDDILVTATTEHLVFLYFGGNSMDTIPDLTFNVPYSGTSIGNFGRLPDKCMDLNGDYYIDFFFTVDTPFAPKTYIFFGGPLLDNQYDLVIYGQSGTPGYSSDFGSYSTTSDFNGDGWGDLIISDPYYDLLDWWIAGKVYVFYGGPELDTIPDFTITADFQNINYLGEGISSGGDVNGDGYDEFICRGSYSLEDGEFGSMMFLGGSNPDTVPGWVITNAALSLPVYWGRIIFPDINNDGYDEIIISVYGVAEGGANIFYGGANVDTLWDVFLDSGPGNTTCLKYCGDINNNGYGDLIIGSGNAGQIKIFFLGPNLSTHKDLDVSIQYNGIGGYYSGGYAGDVNGDGVDDFMFGSWNYPYSAGEVFIYSDTSLSGIRNNIELSIPNFTLEQNYPNPFNPSTIISYNLPEISGIKVEVYNLLGRRVAVLTDGLQCAGIQKIDWNTSKSNLSSGIYFCRMTAKGQQTGKFFDSTVKMMLLK